MAGYLLDRCVCAYTHTYIHIYSHKSIIKKAALKKNGEGLSNQARRAVSVGFPGQDVVCNRVRNKGKLGLGGNRIV